MKEKHRKDEYKKKRKKKREKERERRKKDSSTEGSESDEWVEKDCVAVKNDCTPATKTQEERDGWMSMTGMIKTYSLSEVKEKKEKKDKQFDSYNPGASSRELNPYWKDGGTGLPQTVEEFRKSRQFIKPKSDDHYLNTQSKLKQDDKEHGKIVSSKQFTLTCNQSSSWRISNEPKIDDYINTRSKLTQDDKDHKVDQILDKELAFKQHRLQSSSGGIFNKSHGHFTEPLTHMKQQERQKEKFETKGEYLSDEKMNKLAAKIVKAEILGDNRLVAELKGKLEKAREYRKQNPIVGPESDSDAVMLMATSSTGNCRPLTRSSQVGDPKSKEKKRKVETHHDRERMKYFSNDDKYSLTQMFEQEKYGNNYDDEAQLAKVAAKHRNPNDDLEDIFVDEISKKINTAKQDEREKQRAIRENERVERSLEECDYCVGSKSMLKHLMVSCGNKVYLALPGKRSLVKGQCIITTIHHSTCVTSLDEDVWEEIMNYRKALTKFFNSQRMDVVFFETALRLHRYPHMIINCVPMPRDIGVTLPIYFKKALLECEAEWSMNKKVVELKNKDIRKCVPKGLPYFWIDFGMQPGFAHVIEDQQLFPRTFSEEIIAGILDLDHNIWRNPKREYGDFQRKKVLEFVQAWKPFDIANKK